MGFFQAFCEAINGVAPNTQPRIIPPLFPKRRDIPPLFPDDEPERAVPGAGGKPPPPVQQWLIAPVARGEVLNLHLDQECQYSPFHKYIGNKKAIRQLGRIAFPSLQREDHLCPWNIPNHRRYPMLFSVIYSADCPRSERISRFRPPQPRKLWDMTEDDGQYEYSYLEGDWEKGKHRKWCAMLNKDQFSDFVRATGLVAEDVQTMGSIGAPGFGIGWSPAISFSDDGSERAILNAYVTPIPEVRKDHYDEHDWERVRRAVLSMFGRN